MEGVAAESAFILTHACKVHLDQANQKYSLTYNNYQIIIIIK